MVLRHNNERALVFVYGAVTLSGGPFQDLLLTTAFLQLSEPLAEALLRPTTLTLQRLQPITQREFGLFPFRSPLLRE